MTLFRDRQDAGRQLAAVLKLKGIVRPVVLGIPRGGVPVALEVARALDGELGVVVARKLRAPGQPELAIGAVTASGATFVNEELASLTGAGKQYLERETAAQVTEAARREARFDGHRRPVIRGRTVIVIDDGLATGATAIAALRSLRAEGAARIILAVPVASPETIERMRPEADEVVCLQEESDFYAIGQFYVDFGQVDDTEVRSLLDQFGEGQPSAERHAFIVTRDGVRLAGRMLVPPGAGPFAAVIFVHGLGSDKDSPRNAVIAERLLDEGMTAVLFDLSGHGESGRDARGSDAFEDDLAAVFRWVTARPDIDAGRIGVAGSSYGGTVAVAATVAGSIAPRALVLRAPPIAAADVERLTVPSLAIIGSHDRLIADVSEAAGRCPALTLSVVHGASHLFEEPGALDEALERTVSWFKTVMAEPHATVGA
jgi:predicted phosphoribosyltransferase/alpha/beta superfamily hydrolase